MEIYDVLIVEDEAKIAEFHLHYLSQAQRFRVVGIANKIAEARKMIQILKPKMILLDNYLPDGKGIDLLKEITADKNVPDIIFVTAANDVDTVREALRYGAFDYIMKPVSYERISDSLGRYLKYTSSLKANETINQRHVDALFNFQSRSSRLEQLPKGIDELSLDKVSAVFSTPDTLYSAERLSKELGISKTTARRYLEYMLAKGSLKAVINHGRVGRPQRLYQQAEH